MRLPYYVVHVSDPHNSPQLRERHTHVRVHHLQYDEHKSKSLHQLSITLDYVASSFWVFVASCAVVYP